VTDAGDTKTSTTAVHLPPLPPNIPLHLLYFLCHTSAPSLPLHLYLCTTLDRTEHQLQYEHHSILLLSPLYLYISNYSYTPTPPLREFLFCLYIHRGNEDFHKSSSHALKRVSFDIALASSYSPFNYTTVVQPNYCSPRTTAVILFPLLEITENVLFAVRNDRPQYMFREAYCKV
jgi:hypothetical protein